VPAPVFSFAFRGHQRPTADGSDHVQTTEQGWKQPAALIFIFLKYIFLQSLGLNVLPIQHERVESFHRS